MSDYKSVIRSIDKLESMMPSGFLGDPDWDYKAIWAQIREISASFKAHRFPSREENQVEWQRFQNLVDKVKVKSDERRNKAKDFAENSQRVRDRLFQQAADVLPVDSALFDMVMTFATGGLYLIGKMALDELLGPFDERKADLLAANKRMASVREQAKSDSRSMIKTHRDEVWDKINDTQARLTDLWSAYKDERQKALDQYHREKKERRDERSAKHEAWKDRTRANIQKNENRLDRLRSALSRKQAHLSDLHGKRADAWSDDFRDRVDGWISEAEDAISDIESKIDTVLGYISEDQQKLDDAW